MVKRRPSRYASLVPERDRLFYAFWATAVFLVAIWSAYGLNELLALGWRQYGVHPGDPAHWTGTLTYPFLHSDLEHLWNNTATFFTLNTLLFYFYRSIALRVWGLLYLISGIGLYFIGEGGNHIGASGIIYGLASFLFVSGVVRHSENLMRVSLLVAFLYGGMVWWMLPIEDGISWEGHLSGAVTGALLAVGYRFKGPVDDVDLFPSDQTEPLPRWWAVHHPEDPEVIAQYGPHAFDDPAEHSSSAHDRPTRVNYTLIRSLRNETKLRSGPDAPLRGSTRSGQDAP
jgi:membrane associated rhomboid family serine protease